MCSLDAALYFQGEAPDRRDSLGARISILSRLQRQSRFFVVYLGLADSAQAKVYPALRALDRRLAPFRQSAPSPYRYIALSSSRRLAPTLATKHPAFAIG
jgi:hypothetical protein